MDEGLMRRLTEFGEKGIIEAERMRSVDRNAMNLGLHGRILMESAGRAMAGMALELPYLDNLWEGKQWRRRSGGGTLSESPD